MKNFKKQLENQKKVNEAVEGIFNLFDDITSYSELYRTMAEAQTCIMELMELNRLQSENGKMSICTEEITSFIMDVSEVYRKLKPFAEMLGQVYGYED